MKKFTILILLILLIASTESAAAVGIGVSPSEVKIDNALKGAEYERTITIFNTGPVTTNFSLSSSGDTSDWISFYNLDNRETDITEITIQGEGRTTVLIKFQIPDDIANGDYNGKLNFKSVPGKIEGEDSAQQVSVGTSSQITLTVTGEQIIEGDVTAILVEDIEPGYPLKITTLLKNTGNVMVKPRIDVTITRDEDILDRFSQEGAKIKSSTTGQIITEWPTTVENAPGDYAADVVVSLDGEIIKSNKLPFKILPIGTLTRQGNLTDILIEGEPAIGTLLKIRTYFKNTGQIETSAKFTGEVYKDGALTEVINSDELNAEKNKEVALISYVKLESPGDYTVKGKVIYGGKETPIKEISFNVPDKKSTPGFEGAYAAITLLAIIMINRRKKGET